MSQKRNKAPINPFAPQPKKRKTGDGKGKKNMKQSATQVAFAEFALLKPTKSKPTKQKPTKKKPTQSDETQKSPFSGRSTYITHRIPITFDRKLLVKILQKDPVLAREVITEIFWENRKLAKTVMEKHNRRESLIEKYSYGQSSEDDSDPHKDFLEAYDDEGEVVKKKKQESDVRVDKTKNQTKDEKSKSRKLLDDLAPEKNSLPLNMTFVKSQDSKSKVKEGDQKLRLATSNARFCETIDAKFINFACHALPLMEDEDNAFSKAQKNAVCLASTGMVFDSLSDYRDAFYLRSINKAAFVSLYDKDLKLKPTDMKKRGAKHKLILTKIEELQKKFKKGRKATKMEALFLRIFPGFTKSPIYKA